MNRIMLFITALCLAVSLCACSNKSTSPQDIIAIDDDGVPMAEIPDLAEDDADGIAEDGSTPDEDDGLEDEDDGLEDEDEISEPDAPADENESSEQDKGDESGGQIKVRDLADDVEIKTSIKNSRYADEEELLETAYDVIEMYATGVFSGDNPGATRYPEMPDGCSVDNIEDLTIDKNGYVFPYSVIADVGGGTQMIMGIEYISESKATDERPEGWHVAAVMFKRG